MRALEDRDKRTEVRVVLKSRKDFLSTKKVNVQVSTKEGTELLSETSIF